MLRGVQLMLMLAYAVLPLAMLAWIIWRRRGGRQWIFPVVVTTLVGVGIGTSLVLANWWLIGGTTSVAQGLSAIYFAIAVLCMVKLVDRLLLRGIFRVARVQVDDRGYPAAGNRPRAVLSLLSQRLLMAGLVVPYVFALMFVYRPRFVPHDTPARFDLTYAEASFTAADGVGLSGWWIPAKHRREKLNEETREQWGVRTVVLCHGIGASKAQQLKLANFLAGHGYNVLAFDFRGHGASGGHLISYGDRERYDVLAAVRWARNNYPDQTERIYAVGANTGAAAVLGAAADEGDGQLIDGVVLYEPFARFSTMAEAKIGEMLPVGVGWLMQHIGLPIASLHAGSNLNGFAPVEYVQRVWPRPVLVVHGRGQTFVPFGEAMDLYRETLHPKEQFWPSDNYRQAQSSLRRADQDGELLVYALRELLGLTDAIFDDAGVRYRTLRFLRDARSMRVL